MNVKDGRAYCQYVRGAVEDHGTEALYLYLPVTQGYIQYSFVHSVIPTKQCDVWRMGPAFYCDSDLVRQERLTREGAEWEMAIRLRDRPDFIGGAVHGDEIGEAPICCMDGAQCRVERLTSLTPFFKLTLSVESVGYDPARPSEAVLRHHKYITVESAQILVSQSVEWLCDVPLGRSYMAMMPPLKCVTDCYRLGDTEYFPITSRSFTQMGEFSAISLCGDRGFVFTMRVEHYLSEGTNNTVIITDNGGEEYHKMYFVLAHNGGATRGEVWKTMTAYHIQKKDVPGTVS